MKIGIYDPYLDTLGGGEKYMLSIAECLSKEHDVDIFWDEKHIKQKVEEWFGLDLDGIHFVRNIFSSKVSLYDRLFSTKKYDFIIFLSDGSIPFVLSKLILHFQQPLKIRAGWLKPLKLLRIDRIIYNSNYTKNFIDRQVKKESVVLYPPIDDRALLLDESLSKGKKENVILTVGRYSRLPDGSDIKKHHILIDKFKHMVQNGLKGWQFVLIVSNLPQDKGHVDNLEKQTQGYPITFYRNVSNKEIVRWYKKAKIYWHASGFGEDLEKHPERAEHFGISTAEAMGAGVVPVVINAGGQREIVADGENGFLWNTLSELEEKTRKLIENEKLRLQLAENAKESVKRFNKERFCKEVNQII